MVAVQGTTLDPARLESARGHAFSLPTIGRWLGAHPAVVILSIAVAASTLAWLRLPPTARDTLWAEDGRNFLQAALDHGPLGSLFIPYAGYLDTIPRIAAAVTVQLVPLQFYAIAMTASACAVAGCVAGLVYVCSRDVMPWRFARVAVALLTVLLPLAPREVLGNEANVHSLIFWGLFWVLLYRPRNRRQAALLAAFALLGSLSEIQALFLLPLMLWHARDRARWWPRLACLGGVAIQLAVTVQWPRSPSGYPPVDAGSVVYGFFINCVLPVFLPQGAVGSAVAAGGLWVCLALCAPLVAALVFCLRCGTGPQPLTAVALTVGAVVVYVASVTATPKPYYDYASMSAQSLRSLWLSRYGVVPSLLLCALVLLALTILWQHRQSRRRPRFASGAAVAAMAGLGVLVLLQFLPTYTVRSHGPAWQPQVAALSERCEYMPDAATVTVNETLGWHVAVTCGRFE